MAIGEYTYCTCMRPWMGITPPPPCPTHGPWVAMDTRTSSSGGVFRVSSPDVEPIRWEGDDN